MADKDREALEDAAITADYDDMKVDEFANSMKAKLAKKRDEGRGGWDDPAQCSVEYLATLLLSHIAKGDPVDIANFSMMLFHRKGSDAIRQAARDHYAPKLTEKEAVEAAAVALYEYDPPEYKGPQSSWSKALTWDKDTFRRRATAALRAAGVRFRDDP
jgi:hypothetical protein